MRKIEFIDLLKLSIQRPLFEKYFDAPSLLFQRSEQPLSMFLVVSGEARLIRHSAQGFEIVFQRVRKGVFAEASVDQMSYHCDGLVDAGTRLILVPIDEFRKALKRDDIREYWIKHLSHELRKARAHGERLSLHSARDRIVHYIETEGMNAEYEFKHSKKSWAAEMGLTHEALYRTLRKMREAGQIEISGSVIRLLSP